MVRSRALPRYSRSLSLRRARQTLLRWRAKSMRPPVSLSCAVADATARPTSCGRFRTGSKPPLIHSVKGKDIMPFDDPRWMGGIGMIGTKAVYNAIMQCDLLLMLGTDYPYSEFLPHRGAVIQVDERAVALGRRAPTALGVVG